MVDYHPLTLRFVEGLGASTRESRYALYQRMRATLMAQLRVIEPTLSEADKNREQLALEGAIRKVEEEFVLKSRVQAQSAAPDPLIPPIKDPQVQSTACGPILPAEYTKAPLVPGMSLRRALEENHVDIGEASIAADEGWRDRSKEKPLEGDAQPNSEEDLKTILADLTENKKYDEETASHITKYIKERDLKIIFLEADFTNSYELFNIERKGNTTELTFNRKHPAFSKIFGTTKMAHEDLSKINSAEWLERHTTAVNTIKIIFAAWARYEREAGIPRMSGLQRVRYDWGQIAAQFLKPDDNVML